MPEKTILEWWLREGAVLGFALLFTAGVLLIILWTAVSAIKELKVWLPQWFKSKMAHDERICVAIEEQTGLMGCNHANLHRVRSANLRVVRALNAHLKNKENRDRLGISSDVIVELNRAEETLKTSDDEQ
jgi:hypothetical protein